MLCGVIWDILVHFGKNVVAASRERLYLYKHEKDELGFLALPRKKSNMAIPFLQICKALG